MEHKTNLKVKNQDMKVGKDADNQELLRLSNLKNILAVPCWNTENSIHKRKP